MSTEYPSDLKYTKDHEWLRVSKKDGGDIGRVGITSFAGEQLGDVVAVELPDEGDKINKGEVFGTLESVKAVADLFAPVSGTFLRVNTPLGDSPEYVNEDPYDEGWMVEIQLSDPAELGDLMSAEAYAAFVADQE
ncbi:MAG: glycine cleavage system protein GcvH [Proteobacteria bacterium]|nr:glycine cleavage system protein GcvH [Pseudomonadota bacterium]